MIAAARTLLIVEDDSMLARILRWGFEDLGYRVCSAGDCGEARTHAALTAFDHALIDYRLPDGDGDTLSRELMACQPDLAVVLMSADRAGAEAQIERAPPVLAFVEKPLHLEQLHRAFSSAWTA